MFRRAIKLHPLVRFYSVDATKINVKPPQPIKLFKTDKQPITTDELFAPGKTVVIFGVPGAFTPVCSLKHVPSFSNNADKLKKAGVDTIACVSVNDPFVMEAWQKDIKCGDEILLLGDPEAKFTKQIGLDLDLGEVGLGVRSQRYAMIVKDGKVIALNVEKTPKDFETTTAEVILQQLQKLK